MFNWFKEKKVPFKVYNAYWIENGVRVDTLFYEIFYLPNSNKFSVRTEGYLAKKHHYYLEGILPYVSQLNKWCYFLPKEEVLESIKDYDSFKVKDERQSFLQEQLDDALENEDYEEAARIRDLMRNK